MARLRTHNKRASNKAAQEHSWTVAIHRITRPFNPNKFKKFSFEDLLMTDEIELTKVAGDAW